ncbi:MAG: SGNH/GDSL hydrolase family protein [Planctomycetales bacterium]|nr:SGNH/GDSL hydrolase family protein [Planctomycetales bacterium]NIM09359.1 SGNH/GDSL hydrolase family protein [Planctomycetales bacterium]NIN08826.1 SGNH/GDSL hydrolase family protein [Planctomycetales bacterium]NIN77943.1 SGNH/GDSL hydrolase family protein [Planctomycetales bacterium]NIO35126.1 SGNH/GDSL hydrolase family protein [Planctomycetales bacterium]
MCHVVLLGDSVFDNGVYVPGGPAVIEQLVWRLPEGWTASLLAVDGDVTRDVAGQLAGLPAAATHLVVSVGGNDALGYSGILNQPVSSSDRVFAQIAAIQQKFHTDYSRMLAAVLACGKPTMVCTIYDQVPFADQQIARAVRAALPVFNDVILRLAVRHRLPVIDLREICTEAADFSTLSPIEPSKAGGAKIAAVLARAVTTYDFQAGTVVYGA